MNSKAEDSVGNWEDDKIRFPIKSFLKYFGIGLFNIRLSVMEENVEELGEKVVEKVAEKVRGKKGEKR